MKFYLIIVLLGVTVCLVTTKPGCKEDCEKDSEEDCNEDCQEACEGNCECCPKQVTCQESAQKCEADEAQAEDIALCQENWLGTTSVDYSKLSSTSTTDCTKEKNKTKTLGVL